MAGVKFNRLQLTDIYKVSSDLVFTGLTSNEKQKIQASDKEASDNFGWSVSINGVGDTAIVGAPYEDTGGIYSGASYIFTKNASDIWSERQKIQASDKQASDYFGWSVSINGVGDTAIIGAYGEDTGHIGAGSAYIFAKNTSDIWSEKQKIQASDKEEEDYFGKSVAINGVGDTVIIGAIEQGASNFGAAYIFSKNTSDIWSERQKIQSSDKESGDNFGNSVSINDIGDTAIIGAYSEDTGGAGAGAAYIFTKNVSDIWSEKQKIQASDGFANVRFGKSVSINDVGDTAIIGAYGDNTGGNQAGAAYIFTKNTSDIWSEKQKIQASDKEAYDVFGKSVSINGVGDTAIIGVHLEDTGGANAGAAYIFTKNASDIWSEQQKIQSSDLQAGDFFGWSVSINGVGDTAIVGANLEDTGGANAGAAYIFNNTLPYTTPPSGTVYISDVPLYALYKPVSDSRIHIKIT